MKYFRIHPDLIIIANYPQSTRRVRRGRQSTPQELSKILIQTIAARLRDKKILLLTDAPDTKKHARLIIRTCWNRVRPFSLRHLWHRLIYNYQVSTICILYHPGLFGRMITPIFTPIIILFFRLAGKRTVLIFLTTPALSAHPKLSQAIGYFFHAYTNTLLSMLSSHAVQAEHARAVSSIDLFPSPTKNLGLRGQPI